MKILMISRLYPTSRNRTQYVFVQKLAHALANAGHEVLVIAYADPGVREGVERSSSYTETTAAGCGVQVSLCKGNSYLGRALRKVSKTLRAVKVEQMCQQALARIETLGFSPDVVYGHFLTPSGVIASKIGVLLNVPSFIGYGESSLWSSDPYPSVWLSKHLKEANGVVAVSTENKERLVGNGLVSASKVHVIPNAINGDLFYPRDKERSRERFGIEKEKFVFSFVGQFIARKGLDVVLDALEQVDDAFIILAGEGPKIRRSSRILFSGRIDQELMPYFLSSSDCFVFPTKAEGCSNAILEAIGCELPIITSDLAFNFDILTKEEAILVDPNDPAEVLAAMREIREDAVLRTRLAGEMRRKRGSLLYADRVDRLVELFARHLCKECLD